MGGFTIRSALSADDLAATAALCREYAAALGIDLDYQDFESEMAAWPGRYAPPDGALLLARGDDHAPIGCVALRKLRQPTTCEMKRLYVTPAGRGLGLGEALARALIELAERIGYGEIRLDTLGPMTTAQALYRKLGFATIPPYYPSPIEGTQFMRLLLPPAADSPHR